MERAATTASSLVAEQDSGNINRTQSMATLNESFPYGTGSGSGPRCQDTILGGAKAQIRFKATSKQSNDPPLSRVNTLGSGEDNMKLMELMEHSPTSPITTFYGQSAGLKSFKGNDNFKPSRQEEDSATPTDSHSTPIISQPSSSKPQKKKSRRKQKKDSGPTEPVTDEAHVSTPSYDSLKWLRFSVVEVVILPVPCEIPDELTLAQTLIEIKTAKPKPVTTAATTVKIYQVALDEEMARNLEARLQAKLIEEERLARQKEEEANIVLIESWDNTQAMMEADFELA
ncbi:hypothetical protein Tco_0151697 [Tanacetum coccineum]